MTSTRLPGKNLKPILGRPMLDRLLERLKRSRRSHVVCLATSTDPSDDVLEGIAREAGVEVYRGPLEDVLARTLGAARSVVADVIAEITGDCPLIDPWIVDGVIERYAKGGYDYVTNILDELTFPVGFDVQVYAVSLLEEVSKRTSDPRDRADVTPYIYHHPKRYRLLNLRAPAGLHRPRYRLCVDYQQDFDVITEICSALYPQGPVFSAWKIIDFLDGRPDLVARNNWMPNAFECPSSGGAAAQEVMSLERT